MKKIDVSNWQNVRVCVIAHRDPGVLALKLVAESLVLPAKHLESANLLTKLEQFGNVVWNLRSQYNPN